MVNLIDRLRKARVVPVIRLDNPNLAYRACQLLAEEGITALEITTTIPDAPNVISKLCEAWPDVLIGAGTVLSKAQAFDVLSAGASFVVSPCWCPPVAAALKEAGVPYLPGAMTPGEVHHHSQNGAEVVKIFPASANGGPGFVNALKSVFPEIQFMPTGGITPKSSAQYLSAGALCVGLGSNLVPSEALERGDIKCARKEIRAALAALPSKH